MSRATSIGKHQDNHTNTSNNTSDIIAPKPSLTDDKNRSKLDAVTEEVKQDLRGLFGKTGKLIEKLGNAVKKVVKKEESICEIKIRLKEEIAEGIISTRTIELHCPDEWKRKTKPKNEKVSFSKQVEGKPKQQIAPTQDGKSVIANETSGNTEASDDVNQIHDQSKQYGISVDDNSGAQTTVTNQGELVSYNEPKDNTVGDSASSDVVQKLQPQHDQKEKAMPVNQIAEDRDHKIKQLQRQLYERTQELVDKVCQNAKLSDELRHFKELQTLQKDDASNDVVQKLVNPSDKQIDSLEAQTILQRADEIPGIEFELPIPKEKYGIVRDAMDNSETSIVVKFDRNKNFLGADPDVVFDISGAKHQDGMYNKFSPTM